MLSAFLLPLVIAFPEAPAPHRVGELVSLETSSGTLYGTIDLPAGDGPWPVALLHPGSGPTDRDGNQPNRLLRNDSLKLLGRGLASGGIAVLRIDKRGIGASRKALAKEEDVRLETYAADVVSWIEFLRKDRRFTRVGFIGHSEGSLIGLAAAKDAKPDAFVSLCGPGRPMADILRDQLKKLPREQFPEKLLDESLKVIAELEAGREVKDVPILLRSLFRPSVQPYLISEFKHDPAALVKAYPGPVLVVSGTTDIQVPTAEGNRLAQAKPGTTHRVIEKMNHILKAVPATDRATQLPTYGNPALPLHPEVVGVLTRFLNASLRTK